MGQRISSSAAALKNWRAFVQDFTWDWLVNSFSFMKTLASSYHCVLWGSFLPSFLLKSDTVGLATRFFFAILDSSEKCFCQLSGYLFCFFLCKKHTRQGNSQELLATIFVSFCLCPLPRGEWERSKGTWCMELITPVRTVTLTYKNPEGLWGCTKANDRVKRS